MNSNESILSIARVRGSIRSIRLQDWKLMGKVRKVLWTLVWTSVVTGAAGTGMAAFANAAPHHPFSNTIAERCAYDAKNWKEFKKCVDAGSSPPTTTRNLEQGRAIVANHLPGGRNQFSGRRSHSHIGGQERWRRGARTSGLWDVLSRNQSRLPNARNAA
ncbi:hypothetical protein ACFYV7_39460 [Nocardia suismassiliense]|uniref:Uncharacterized protein n=1 Tax=Nocardia suismassiliense TaxID=2077092 RepID=A0ABW6R871_9NOCA